MDEKIKALKRRLNRLNLLMQAKTMFETAMNQQKNDKLLESLQFAREFINKYSTLHELICLAIVDKENRRGFKCLVVDYIKTGQIMLDKLERHFEFLEGKTWLKQSEGTGILEVIEELHDATHSFLKARKMNLQEESPNETREADCASAAKYVFKGPALSDLGSISGGAFFNVYGAGGAFKGVSVGNFEYAMFEYSRVDCADTERHGPEGSTGRAFESEDKADKLFF